MINTTLCIVLNDGKKIVLKISPHRVDKAYAHEAYQLQILRESGLPTPEVYRWKIGSLEDPFSYILLEFIEGETLHDAKHHSTAEQYDHLQIHLAELIAILHDHKSETYRRLRPSSPSPGNPGEGRGEGDLEIRAPHDFPNHPHPNPLPDYRERGQTSWPQFFREIYDPIWHECEKSPHLPKGCRKQIAKVHEKLDRLVAHSDCPRLVHWDIWSTNVLAKPDSAGNWWVTGVLDPNCKYAHFEAEIAYMELFHTVTAAFMKAYQQHHKIPPEYHRYRKCIYQLYPLIDHVNLFGHEYVKPLMEMVQKTEALV